MDNFEEEVQYFINLVFNNMQLAKNKRGKKAQEEAIFLNLNVKLDGTEVAVWNTDIEGSYILSTKNIQEFNFKNDINKYLALRYIEKLTKYSNNQITIKEYLGIQEETNKVVKKLLEQKNNASEQLKLLRSNRKLPEVQEYIDDIYNDKYATPYIRYLIDRYYYNKKDLFRPEKDGLEKMFKVLFH